MKAIQFRSKDEMLLIQDAQMPELKEGYNIVEVSHASINHRDLWISKGKYAKIKFPIIPGSDFCGYLNGTRILVNPGFFWGNNNAVQSDDFQILGLPQNGCFATFVSVPEEYIYKVPEHLSDAEASALPLAGITAYRALFSKCKPVAGETILIHGIGGGVALHVLQFAVVFGLKVFVTSSDDHKIEKAIQLGAIHGVNYLHSDWDVELLKESGGFDIIIDSAAGISFQKLLNLCNGGARICIYGGTQGIIDGLSPQKIFWKQLSIFGSTMGTQNEFKEMLEFVEANKLVSIIDSISAFTEFETVFKKMESGNQFGKLVLKIKE
ncbi:MAG: zinc-binding dehydrogenase [Saprospiraceae bacterium]|nr:zinc-binding dehydrogenase [Saprospiraceae bacterium]